MFVTASEAPAQPRVVEGRLLRDHIEGAAGGLDGYLEAGGYEVLSRAQLDGAGERALELLDAANLRGRAGGGFPTAAKWHQVANASSDRKFFVCNAHSGQPGGYKESFLIGANPHRVLEAVALGAAVIGAEVAIIYLGKSLEREQVLLESALDEVKGRFPLCSGLKAPDIRVYRSSGGYITGEETALLELLEGRSGTPRGKPPLPTRTGLLGAPTVVDNLETVLQAFFVIKHGHERFREVGTKYCSGTLIFCLGGEVERPGIYELPLGVSLRTLVFEYGGGILGERKLKGALVGGVAGTMLGPDSLDIPLDYDSLADVHGDLGGGVVIVVSDSASMVGIARELAEFYYDNSCGKCQPCKDGTRRTLYMLNHLDEIDQKAVDWKGVKRPSSSRAIPIKLIDQQAQERAGISYTDGATGLDKIRLLCRWYEHRGDCHHATEAARAVLSVLDAFSSEFEADRLKCETQT